ncbi:hypothetical protein ThimaDRAFT_3137 [Thiocapsa marina 5811]|uniref:Uncharacterized protein n=1 Tax=Thiocapsa marina 5811 TaxID=768671 RepID=F9UE35_9GAMM|nr:hypothetical protein ThimaDRAFT_3137 [Thiocapsa marina 5811]
MAGRVPEGERSLKGGRCTGVTIFETDADGVRVGFRKAADQQFLGRLEGHNQHDGFLNEIGTR